MSNTWMVPEDQVDTAARTAENLARAAKHSGGSELPALANSKIDESAVKNFMDWLRSLFQFKSSPSTMNAEFFFTFLYWTAIALAVIGVLYLVYYLVTRARGPAAPGVRGSPVLPALSTEALISDLAAALAAGQFARAARIRWRLFLLRNQRSPDVTPYEHFRSRSAAPEDWVAKHYRTMFAATVTTRPEYDDLASRLAKLEAER